MCFALLGMNVHAQVQNPIFKIGSNVIQPAVNAWTFKLPYLGATGIKCVQVDNTGFMSTSTSSCGSGETGNGFPGLLTAWSSTNNLIATSSPTIGYLTATSTTATSTFSGGISAQCITVFGGSACLPSNATSTNFWYAKGTNIYNANSGNVGIGTTSPGQKLSVAGDILGNTIIGSSITATSTTATSTFQGGISAQCITVFGGSTCLPNNATSTNYWYANGTNLYNTNSGNIGIGTTTPATALEVYNSGGDLQVSGNSSNLFLDASQAFAFRTGKWNGTFNTGAVLDTMGNFHLGYGGGGVSVGSGYQAITPPANGAIFQGIVGIGTTTPWKALSVVGGLVATNLDAFVTSDSAVCYRSNGLITFDSGVSSCIVSSRKVKHDILSVSASDSLTRIMALNPVGFEYNGTNQKDLGLVADEVVKIDPRYAQYAGQDEKQPDGQVIKKGDPSAINWAAITADLIKTVQTQQREIDALNARLDKLKNI